MSAKHPKKSAAKSGTQPPVPAGTPVAATPLAATSGAAPASAAPAEATSWLDSADPRKRMWGKIIFIGIWIYVGALWLLALDQTFNWGVFGPKVPPVP